MIQETIIYNFDMDKISSYQVYMMIVMPA
ncbi:hypothetical protein LINPERPRIM_LOCUS24479 [Linum perenne]